MSMNLDSSVINELVEKTLSEDIQNGDITTRNIFKDNKNVVAEVIARESMVLCGLEIFQAIFNKLTAKVIFTSCEYKDADEFHNLHSDVQPDKADPEQESPTQPKLDWSRRRKKYFSNS